MPLAIRLLQLGKLAIALVRTLQQHTTPLEVLQPRMLQATVRPRRGRLATQLRPRPLLRTILVLKLVLDILPVTVLQQLGRRVTVLVQLLQRRITLVKTLLQHT